MYGNLTPGLVGSGCRRGCEHATQMSDALKP